MSCSWISLGLLLLALQQSAQATEPRAVLTDGESFVGRLVGLDDDRGTVEFQVGEETRSVAVEQLVRWGRCSDTRRGSLLALADGSLLAAEVFAADEENILADSDLLGMLRLQRAQVLAIAPSVPMGRDARDELLKRMVLPGGMTDLILLENGDTVVGQWKGLKEDTLAIDTQVGPLELDRRQCRAVILRRSPKGRMLDSQERWFIGLEDGSRIVAEEMVVDQGMLAIRTIGGLALSVAMDRLVYLAPRGNGLVYLSDLEASEYRHIPYLDLAWPYSRDQSVGGRQLRVEGQIYLKGLGMHSTSRLTYQLDRPYRLFQAELAIDDETEGVGSVRFRVFLDGREAYSGPTIRALADPVPISLELNGARRIDLVVDFADKADQGDHANWLGARVVE